MESLVTLSPKDVTVFLKEIVAWNDRLADEGKSPAKMIVPYIVGSPGIGKSAAAYVAFNDMGRKLETVVAANYDPAELGGFTYRGEGADAGTMFKTRPFYIPADPKSRDGIFFDEVSQTTPLGQSVLAQAVYDRRFGPHELPAHCPLLLAGNRVSDRANAYPMARHLLNRLTIVEMKVPAKDWLDWAGEAELHAAVVGFIAFRKEESLDRFDPKLEVNATPRAWEKVSALCNMTLPSHVKRAAIYGTVGNEHGQVFMGFLKHMDECPKPEEIIANPMGTKIPQDQQIIYATVSALMGHVSSKTTKPIIQYLDRIERKEYATFAIRYMSQRDKALVKDAAVRDWMVKNAKLFI